MRNLTSNTSHQVKPYFEHLTPGYESQEALRRLVFDPASPGRTSIKYKAQRVRSFALAFLVHKFDIAQGEDSSLNLRESEKLPQSKSSFKWRPVGVEKIYLTSATTACRSQ